MFCTLTTQAFQIYLYFLSLVFLLYVQGCLLWGIKSSRYEYNIRYSFRRSKSGSPDRDTEEKLTDIEKIRESSPFPDDSLRGRLTLPAEGTVAHVGEGINFYLRLGAIGKIPSYLTPNSDKADDVMTTSELSRNVVPC